MLGTIATIAFWLVFIVGGAIFLAWFSGTLGAVIVTVMLIVGVPLWAIWSTFRD